MDYFTSHLTITSFLSYSKYMTQIINLQGIKTETEFHSYIKQKFRFPYYYGCNWNAFIDCMGDDIRIDEENNLKIYYSKESQAIADQIVDCVKFLKEVTFNTERFHISWQLELCDFDKPDLSKIINLQGIKNEQQFFGYISKELGFGEYFNHDWKTFSECMQDELIKYHKYDLTINFDNDTGEFLDELLISLKYLQQVIFTKDTFVVELNLV